MGTVYKLLHNTRITVEWYVLIAGNNAKPRVVTCLWLACHRRLATKDRLVKWGLITEVKRCPCNEVERINHLLFGCAKMKQIWRSILQWIQVEHQPLPWDDEVKWLTTYCGGKGKRVWIMRVAIAKTIYHCWKLRNAICFENHIDCENIVNNIIEAIIHRSWHCKRYREYTTQLMM
ncbi:uncharacterized protein LOC131613182 [Vicia villosa]|uniref:uncharacterized protein LOC131613182 n=1 Tax=Vicia villosa TaxID=3911 RepID=UPI00273BBFDC|nr:uncharacterized protein LOC131613182 [Vicia villosa]